MRVSFLLLILAISAIEAKSQTVINKYAAVLSRDACQNIINVDAATDFAVGDTILMIQMKGATIDVSNTASYGNVTSYNGAGNYEYNIIAAKNGNALELKHTVVKQFDIPAGKVQIVRVPYFPSYSVTQPHTCAPWDGSKGGVFAINVAGNIDLQNTIDVSSKGFRAAALVYYSSTPCSENGFKYDDSPTTLAALKGEGIYDPAYGETNGRGANANGGGGGNTHNGGGAGGGNGGSGGLGGKESPVCFPPLANGGVGGNALPYTNSANRIFLGGGAGQGHANNAHGSTGGNGGGIIIINAQSVSGNGNSLLANGGNGGSCLGNCWDAQPGGGAGGTILISAQSYSSQVIVSANGGDGGSLSNGNATGQNGTGGGGGGGVIWMSSGSVPAMVSTSVNGGAKGLFLTNSNDSWGATDGQAGQVINSLQLPQLNSLFVGNQINVDFTAAAGSNCLERVFTDITTTTSSGIISWHWNFGGLGTSTQQNPSFTFPGPGTYNVSLIVTDGNGCKDSVTKPITIAPSEFATAGGDTTICAGVQANIWAAGGVSYSWSPAYGLATPNAASTAAYPATTTNYIVTVTDATGCIDQDTVTVTVLPAPSVSAGSDTTVCKGSSITLVGSANGPFSWQPASRFPNPFAPTQTVTVNDTSYFSLVSTGANGCIGADTVAVYVFPDPVFAVTPPSATICKGDTLNLMASGGSTYLWSPGVDISDVTSATTTVYPTDNQTYFVQITDTVCHYADTLEIRVSVELSPELTLTKSNDITCDVASAQLGARGAYKYTWFPAASLSNPLIPNPVTTTRDTRWYYVTGETLNGCKSLDSIQVKVDFSESEKIFVPDAFTPNGDGKNDCFSVKFAVPTESFYLAIYNRFGELVFDSRDRLDCWDGRHRGVLQPLGTYYYYYQIRTEGCGEIFGKGDVHLLR